MLNKISEKIFQFNENFKREIKLDELKNLRTKKIEFDSMLSEASYKLINEIKTINNLDDVIFNKNLKFQNEFNPNLSNSFNLKDGISYLNKDIIVYDKNGEKIENKKLQFSSINKPIPISITLILNQNKEDKRTPINVEIFVSQINVKDKNNEEYFIYDKTFKINDKEINFNNFYSTTPFLFEEVYEYMKSVLKIVNLKIDLENRMEEYKEKNEIVEDFDFNDR